MLKATLRDSLVYGTASLLTKGMGILLLPLYTRVLAPGAYGAYDLLVTAGTLANLCVALEVGQGLARHWAEMPDAQERRTLASTTLWFTLSAYAVFVLACEVASRPLTLLLLGDARFENAFRLGVVFMALNGVQLLVLNQFRWELRSRAYAVVSCAGVLLTLVLAAVLCLRFGLGLEGVMLAQAGSACCTVLAGLWLLRGSFGRQFSPALLRTMLAFSAPLVPAGVAVFLSLYVNRFVLGHFGSLEDVGVFGLASRLAGIPLLLVSGVQAALTPLVYQHHADPETPGRVARLFGWFCALALGVCLALSLFARELLALLSTGEFMAAAVLVPVLAPALLLSQLYVFAPGIAIAKKTVLQLWVTLAAAIVGVLGNCWLVPLWGGPGAAAATLLSSGTFFLLWLAVGQRLYPVPYAWRALAAGVGTFAGCAIAGVWLDAGGPGGWFSLALKASLLGALAAVVVVAGLLPARDLRAGLGLVQRRLGVPGRLAGRASGKGG